MSYRNICRMKTKKIGDHNIDELQMTYLLLISSFVDKALARCDKEFDIADHRAGTNFVRQDTDSFIEIRFIEIRFIEIYKRYLLDKQEKTGKSVKKFYSANSCHRR